MRQLGTLAYIATRAGNHDIFGVVRSAFRDRYDVVNVVRLADFLAAPIAFSFLGFILALYVIGGMGTDDHPALEVGVTGIGSSFFGISLTPIPFPFRGVITGVSTRISRCVITLNFPESFRVRVYPFFYSSLVMLVAHISRANKGISTRFALMPKSVRVGTILVEVIGISRKGEFALEASLKNVSHSMSPHTLTVMSGSQAVVKPLFRPVGLGYLLSILTQ